MKHDTPLPVGVIGTGRMGRLHARTYAKMPEVNLVGVYDMNADAAADVAGEFTRSRSPASASCSRTCRR